MALLEWYRHGFIMAPRAWLALGVMLGLLVVAVVLVWRGLRRRELVRRFGDEYLRAVEEYGSEKAAMKELRAREARVKSLHLKSLSGRKRRGATEQWLKIQASFISDPIGAVRKANLLIKTIMQQQGYPAAEPPEQRLADLTVDHAHVVRHYREGRELSERGAEPSGTTEHLRQAMIHYGKVVEELVEPTAAAVAAWRSLKTT